MQPLSTGKAAPIGSGDSWLRPLVEGRVRDPRPLLALAVRRRDR